MNQLTVEERGIEVHTSLSSDIAKHIMKRLKVGAIVVVSKQPTALLASTRKQWLRLVRQLENRRAGTTDATKIANYSKQIARMQQADFSAKPPAEDPFATVLFATAEELLRFAPMCQTMYVATPTEKETLHKITSFMPEGGVVVIYKLVVSVGFRTQANEALKSSETPQTHPTPHLRSQNVL